MTAEVVDRHPPDAVAKVLNPVMRAVLRSPAGRMIGGLAELEFEGRRTGRRHRVVVGWHEVDGQPVVLSPAPWRINFLGGRSVRVWHRGRARPWQASLDTDPVAVAGAMNALIRSGTSPGSMGVRMPAGHEISSADVDGVHRALIRFSPAS